MRRHTRCADHATVRFSLGEHIPRVQRAAATMRRLQPAQVRARRKVSGLRRTSHNVAGTQRIPPGARAIRDRSNPVKMTVSLVLLPGFDGTGELFRPLLGELPHEVEPIVLHYPTREVLDYSALTQLVLRSLPTERPFVLLGESFSGPVAVLAAAAQPKGLLGVILCTSFVSPPRPRARDALPLAPLLPLHTAARIASSYLLMGRFTDARLKEAMLAALDQVPSRVLRGRLAAAATVDVTSQLCSLDIPTLYLQATEDAVVPSAAAAAFSRLARRSSVAVVVGPHFLLQCAPSEAAKAIVHFIEQVQRKTP